MSFTASTECDGRPRWFGRDRWTTIRRLLMVLVAVTLSLMRASGDAPVPQAGGVHHVYSYDAPAHDSVENHTAPERGPPLEANHTATTTYGAVNRWSNGTSARPEGAKTPTYTPYNVPVRLAWAGLASRTTQVDVRRTVGALSLFQGWHVAAKTVDEFANVGFRSDPAHMGLLQG